ncbi:hypothetical protein ABH944_007780 [Caballeronia udeis]|uniref:Uncharacterized protein n=1 Tax=Caballeronia udeis TaxID=1232866 RepID=A0ABW8MVP2_9BURK
MSDVIQLASFRKPAPLPTAQTKITSRLHIDIMNDGSIEFPPVEVAQTQALTMLRVIIAFADYCLDQHNGRGLGQ